MFILKWRFFDVAIALAQAFAGSCFDPIYSLQQHVAGRALMSYKDIVYKATSINKPPQEKHS